MTNWHDPALEAAQGLVVIKLIHVFAGIYIWEFVLNLDYEHSIITRKRKFNLSALFYLGCRWSTLLDMISTLVNLNTSYGIDCEAWVIATFVLVYFVFQSAACLIILRIYALWERKMVIVIVTFVAWLAIIAVFVYDAIIIVPHAHRDGNICQIAHVVDLRITAITIFSTNIVFLSLMIFGVLRWRQAGLAGGGIWRVMYTQGLIYILVATIAHVPPATFLFLNLNEPMDEMFTVPCTIIMSVGALRMYRGLVDSAALNGPLDGLIGTTRPPTIRFARPVFREGNTHKTEGAMLDLCSTPSPNETR